MLLKEKSKYLSAVNEGILDAGFLLFLCHRESRIPKFLQRKEESSPTFN